LGNNLIDYLPTPHAGVQTENDNAWALRWR
jgi:hypothetical protein